VLVVGYAPHALCMVSGKRYFTTRRRFGIRRVGWGVARVGASWDYYVVGLEACNHCGATRHRNCGLGEIVCVPDDDTLSLSAILWLSLWLLGQSVNQSFSFRFKPKPLHIHQMDIFFPSLHLHQSSAPQSRSKAAVMEHYLKYSVQRGMCEGWFRLWHSTTKRPQVRQ
jgi:hypothetical protein